MRYWLTSGQTLAAVATDLGLSPECLRSWRKQIEATSATSLQDPSTAESVLEQNSKELVLAREIGELRRELEAMTRQRDILKRLSVSSPKTPAAAEV